MKLNHAIRDAGCVERRFGAEILQGEMRIIASRVLVNLPGSGYWKVDIGDPKFNLVRLRNQTHIPLTLEHVHGEWPVNGDWRKDGRFGAQRWGSDRMEILQHTDVYRTYDVTSILSLPTTLDRVSEC